VSRDWLAATGWDPAYGARPLKRVIQRNLQGPLAEMILAGEVADGDHMVILNQGDVLIFNGQGAADRRNRPVRSTGIEAEVEVT
jgi:ATP-dependent Clp protease ATP-binding subunit ClpB